MGVPSGADSDADADPDPDSHSHSHSDPNPDPNADANSHCHTDSYTYVHFHPHANPHVPAWCDPDLDTNRPRAIRARNSDSRWSGHGPVTHSRRKLESGNPGRRICPTEQPGPDPCLLTTPLVGDHGWSHKERDERRKPSRTSHWSRCCRCRRVRQPARRLGRLYLSGPGHSRAGTRAAARRPCPDPRGAGVDSDRSSRIGRRRNGPTQAPYLAIAAAQSSPAFQLATRGSREMMRPWPGE